MCCLYRCMYLHQSSCLKALQMPDMPWKVITTESYSTMPEPLPAHVLVAEFFGIQPLPHKHAISHGRLSFR